MSVLQTFTQPQPAAGAEMVWTMPASAPASFQVVSMRLQLITSAAVANRRPRFLFLDNSAAPLEFWRQASGSDQAASLTWIYCLSQTAPAQAVQGLTVSLGLPTELTIGPGFQFKTSTLLIDAADQWSSLTIVGLAT